MSNRWNLELPSWPCQIQTMGYFLSFKQGDRPCITAKGTYRRRIGASLSLLLKHFRLNSLITTSKCLTDQKSMKIKEYLHWPILEESLQAAIVARFKFWNRWAELRNAWDLTLYICTQKSNNFIWYFGHDLCLG